MIHLLIIKNEYSKRLVKNVGLEIAKPRKHPLKKRGDKMKHRIIGTLLITTVMIGSSCSHKKDQWKKERIKTNTQARSHTRKHLQDFTEKWPLSSQSAINGLYAKYGLPNSITSDMVIWNTTPPFKKTVVFKEQIIQKFPFLHWDVIQQTIDYKVPVDKISQLAKFNGSLIVDRTKGELSSRSEKEEMNFLAFNLADKIIRGDLSVEEARREYTKSAEEFVMGSTNPMLSEFVFRPQTNTADPDRMMQSQEIKTNRK
jgi:hypothetical protein